MISYFNNEEYIYVKSFLRTNPIEARIVKRIEKPLLLKVLVFKKTIFQMELKKKAKPKQKSYLFNFSKF